MHRLRRLAEGDRLVRGCARMRTRARTEPREHEDCGEPHRVSRGVSSQAIPNRRVIITLNGLGHGTSRNSTHSVR
jgi:hypothetical protein